MSLWTELGPRERELLAILRRAEQPLTTRHMLEAVRSRGDTVAYTTVKRTAERLVEKGLLERDAEQHGGTTRHRYSFDVEAARTRLVPEFAAELRAVLGQPAVEELTRAVRTDTHGHEGDGTGDRPRDTDDDY